MIAEKTHCTGCGACKDICPANCIQMSADDEGFLYPTINQDMCIRCGKCARICPVNNAQEKLGDTVAYAAINNNDEIRQQSSSGGVFTALAEHVINNGGVVFGAAFNAEFQVKHIYVETIEQLDRLRGSKYVQSEIGDCYKQAREFLEADRLVLFTGTPCQIGGLFAFLGKTYENLYTQDIICHGVPSPMLWDKYLAFRESQAESKVRSVFFRYKKHGWKTFSVLFNYSNDTEYVKPLSQDPYMQAFLKDLCLRPSCYHCVFKTVYRQADITLADFWGVEKCNPEMDDDKGTSLVLLHSSKGVELFDSVRESLVFEKTDLGKAISFNSAMLKAVPLKPERSRFMHDVLCEDFAIIEKRHLKEKLSKRLKSRLKLWLRSIKKRIDGI